MRGERGKVSGNLILLVMRIIAITGGIGSGKSVVSTILRKLGYAVYDCDSRAKLLIATSADIKRELAEAFGADVVAADGTICAPRLAAKVFGDNEALMRLNGIVHPRVKQDILRWAEGIASSNVDCCECRVFVETAILHESGLDTIVDEEWQVTAPEDVRVARVMKRNGISEADVRRRIASQSNYTAGIVIVNDGVTAILPQIMMLMGQ